MADTVTIDTLILSNQQHYMLLNPPSSPRSMATKRNKKCLSLTLKKTLKNRSQSTSRLKPPKTSLFRTSPKSMMNPYSHGPVCILPFLYLGSEQNANDLDVLNTMSIQYVINAATEVNTIHTQSFEPLENLLNAMQSPSLAKHKLSTQCNRLHNEDTTLSTKSSHSFSSQYTQTPIHNAQITTKQPIGYKKISWTHQQEGITDSLDDIIALIHRARATGHSILIHCQCGVARSATIVIAYVMKVLSFTMEKAYAFVKYRAPAISPNMHLIYQLQKYEQTLEAGNRFAIPFSPRHHGDTDPGQRD
ncbi:protein-tyrosine phosphatase-like protein [Spinellus fusiger]|nr:protein-tyrosine phosphatase-like protein [Spinellus fusiger]